MAVLHILLGILKIAGILLAVLLGLLPVSYTHLSGNKIIVVFLGISIIIDNKERKKRRED